MDERDHVAVLLVDDQPIVAEAIRRTLSGVPHVQFSYCRDASSAHEAAERLKPTVILQDLVMPGIDGMALLRQYRRNPAIKDVPIIVLSTKEEPAVKSESFANGANDYLVKLPDRLELLARMHYHSRAYVHQLQRDEAFEELRRSRQLLVEKNLELERFSHVDGLTGISNRRYFDNFSTMQWKQAIRERTPYSILMIDVDNFKSYNDTYGHVAGDAVLIRVATALKRTCMRPTDLVARFGGEEFIASLETDLPGAAVVAEKLRAAVAAAAIPHLGATLTVSIGGATASPRENDSVADLIEAADAALYDAKRAGKNRCTLYAYDPSRLPRAKE